MRLCRTQSGASVTLIILVLSGASLLLPSRLTAQACTAAVQMSSQSATFSGNGNNNFPSNFTKYNPPAYYKLVSVVLFSDISITATWQMTNNGVGTATVKPGVIDEDFLQLSGVDIMDATGADIGDVVTSKTYATATTIAPGATKTVGPTNILVNQAVFTAAIDTITSANTWTPLSSFTGTGTLPLNYINSAGYSVTGTGSSNVTTVATYSMTTNLTMRYYYCYTGLLATDIVSFTATNQNNGTILLDWLTANETPGRNYIVQVSPGDGADFTDLATVPANAMRADPSYSYTYTIQPSDKGVLYFRLKVVDLSGATAYSAMKVINLAASTATGISLFPNPSREFINLTIPGNPLSWQVDVLAADGSLVQRNLFSPANTLHLDFNRRLAEGAYFVRAVNPQGGQQYTASFIVR